MRRKACATVREIRSRATLAIATVSGMTRRKRALIAPPDGIAFALAACVAGCAAARSIPSATSPETRQPGWVEIARTSTTTAYLDTARLERQSNGLVDAWFRLVYSPPISPDFFPPVDYEAAESRQQVDCARGRTRGIEMRMQPVGGKPTPSKVPDRDWQPITTHRLGPDIFRVLCRSIDGLRPR